MTTTSNGNYDGWIDQTAYDVNGNKVGTIEEIFYDNASRRPEWVSVATGMFGSKHAIVPIAGSSANTDDNGPGLRLAFTKDEIKGAPHVDTDTPLTPDEERTLYSHYGYDYADSTNTNYGFGTNYRKAQRADKDFRYRNYDENRQDWHTQDRGHEEIVAEATAVSEEVQKTKVPETVRLRKYQHTEMVPVTKEEVRVEKSGDTTVNVGDVDVEDINVSRSTSRKVR